jgi:hypothetical protein
MAIASVMASVTLNAQQDNHIALPCVGTGNTHNVVFAEDAYELVFLQFLEPIEKWPVSSLEH